MGHSQAEKARTHDRLLEIASRRFRELGPDGLSIAALMNEAGLTQGGFYKHFASRRDLVDQALAISLQGSGIRAAPAPRAKSGTLAFRKLVDDYLGQRHRDSIGGGCALSALVSDVARAGGQVRQLYSAEVEHNLDQMEHWLGDQSADDTRTRAIVALSAMVGAIGLARAVDSKPLSDEILGEVRRFLKEAFTAGREEGPGPRA